MRSIAVATALAVLSLAVPAAAYGSWQWPVAGEVITPYRNGADPYAGGQHRGIDIGAPVGTTVVAAADGTVTFAGVAGSSGLIVAVRTTDGFDTSYLHLSAIRVRAGEPVAAGAALGAVGTSGRRSAAEPHLHFGVREAGTRFAYRDPLDFLPWPPPSAAPRHVPVPVPLPTPIVLHAKPAAVPVGPRPAPVGPRPTVAPHALVGSALPSLAGGLLGAPASPAPVGGHHAAIHATPRGAGALGAPRIATPVSTAGRRGAHAHGGRSRGAPASVSPHAHHGAATPHSAPPGAAPRPAAGPSAPAARALVHARPVTRRELPRPGASHGGPDLGWLVACVAIVAAAVLLGRPRQVIGSLLGGLGATRPAPRAATSRRP